MSCRSSLVFFEGGFTTSSRLPPPPTALRLANWIFSFKPSSWITEKAGAEPSKSGKSMEIYGKYDGKLKENIQYTDGCKSCRISACWSVGFQLSSAYTWANSQSVLPSFSGPGEVGWRSCRGSCRESGTTILNKKKGFATQIRFSVWNTYFFLRKW